MSFLAAVAGAMKRSAGIALSALFSSITDASGGGPTAGNTVTLTMASGKTVTVTHSLGGTLRYKKNAGAFTSCPSGTTIAVVNSDTLQFDYASGGGEAGTVTLSVSGASFASFLCTGT
ncbi:MAG: hypothetical protein EBR82_88105 [Caulobacteraceae bacterium]|nr:hypothetical protein [Caulobacteraceae bacterium]